ncbi:MAG: urease accessory protein UreE [Elainella sp.]
MLTLTQRFAPDPSLAPELTLALTAEDRTRSRYCFETPTELIYLRLPRGTVLRHNDLLRAEATADQPATWVRVIAKPEPVMVVTASTPLALLRAAYHLGNRHVPLEVTPNYLRFASDPVLKAMLMQLDVQVTEAILPFQPEAGAYGQHGHDHIHSYDSKDKHIYGHVDEQAHEHRHEQNVGKIADSCNS